VRPPSYPIINRESSIINPGGSLFLVDDRSLVLGQGFFHAPPLSLRGPRGRGERSIGPIGPMRPIRPIPPEGCSALSSVSGACARYRGVR